eukprot:Sspe_Gene.37666::Locus_18179_Transcript_1_1_Confidence_1.000_Length_841::g.37666::m.37666
MLRVTLRRTGTAEVGEAPSPPVGTVLPEAPSEGRRWAVRCGEPLSWAARVTRRECDGEADGDGLESESVRGAGGGLVVGWVGDFEEGVPDFGREGWSECLTEG